jgi:hypothetical protein
VPKALIFRVFKEQLGHLFWLGLDLLQTQDIGLNFIQPGETILVDDRSYSVDIPGCNSHSARLFKAYGKLII